MKEFSIKRNVEKVKINGVELNLTDDPTPDIFCDLLSLTNMDNPNKNDFIAPFNALRKYFYLENDQKMVNKFFVKLGIKSQREIWNFIVNYLTEASKNNTEKKNMNS